MPGLKRAYEDDIDMLDAAQEPSSSSTPLPVTNKASSAQPSPSLSRRYARADPDKPRLMRHTWTCFIDAFFETDNFEELIQSYDSFVGRRALPLPQHICQLMAIYVDPNACRTSINKNDALPSSAHDATLPSTPKIRRQIRRLFDHIASLNGPRHIFASLPSRGLEGLDVDKDPVDRPDYYPAEDDDINISNAGQLVWEERDVWSILQRKADEPSDKDPFADDDSGNDSDGEQARDVLIDSGWLLLDSFCDMWIDEAAASPTHASPSFVRQFPPQLMGSRSVPSTFIDMLFWPITNDLDNRVPYKLLKLLCSSLRAGHIDSACLREVVNRLRGLRDVDAIEVFWLTLLDVDVRCALRLSHDYIEAESRPANHGQAQTATTTHNVSPRKRALGQTQSSSSSSLNNGAGAAGASSSDVLAISSKQVFEALDRRPKVVSQKAAFDSVVARYNLARQVLVIASKASQSSRAAQVEAHERDWAKWRRAMAVE